MIGCSLRSIAELSVPSLPYFTKLYLPPLSLIVTAFLLPIEVAESDSPPIEH